MKMMMLNEVWLRSNSGKDAARGRVIPKKKRDEYVMYGARTRMRRSNRQMMEVL